MPGQRCGLGRVVLAALGVVDGCLELRALRIQVLRIGLRADPGAGLLDGGAEELQGKSSHGRKHIGAR